MGKRYHNTRCVYCLREFEWLTSDHIFPKSWYPESTPANLEKWQVPACEPCNQKYSKTEDELLVRLGLCVNPKDHRASGVGERAAQEPVGQQFIEILNSVGIKHFREPGIEVKVGLANDDPQTGMFCIDIWGHFTMYATVRLRKEEM